LNKTSPRNPESPSFYDPNAAAGFFRSAGKERTVAMGTTIFSESSKGMPLLLMPSRIYLLLQGEVEIVARGEPIVTLGAGEIFGEMASLGQMPRSASAVARTDCRVIGLDDAQFQTALGKDPGFALMLLSIMAARLRETLARLDGPVEGWREAAALDSIRNIPPVDVATTGNVTLSGVPANIDAGVSLVSGTTTIFVWQQTNATQNGVYLYNSGGAWTRLAGWDTPTGFRPAVTFLISGGTLYGGRSAWLVTSAPVVIGTTQIIFQVEILLVQPTADGQSFFYQQSTNEMIPSGLKTHALADANASIDVTLGSEFTLDVQLGAARTLTLGNTGASNGWSVIFNIRVTLAFSLTVINALGTTILTLPAGSKWLGGCVFNGGQWGTGQFSEGS